MKLRSGKIIKWPTANFNIDVPVAIKSELKTVIYRLKDILRDDQDFAKLLIEKSLLIGKDNSDPTKVVFRNDINDLITTAYPEVYLSKEGEDDDLLTIAYKLGSLIYGSHELTRKEMIKHPREEWDQCRKILRTKIEKEVKDIFNFVEENVIKYEEVEVIGSPE